MIALPLIVLVAGCTGGEDTATAACEDEPVVTWESYGQALLNEHCQSCHASTAADRFGAPEDVTFDTEEQAVSFKDDILRVATGDNPTMPPSLSIGDTDRERLWIWLTCYEP